MTFPDVEALVMAAIDAAGIVEETGQTAPADLEQRLPFARVTRHGGGDDRVTDTARITIDVFASTRQEAHSAAEQIRDLLTARGGHVTDDDVLDSITTDTGPFEVPWGNPHVRRYVAAYRVSARR